MKKLYIIGNGFDLYHELPTSYECFNRFMCREHPEDHEWIGGIFNSTDTNKLWSKYEEELGKLDVSRFVTRFLPHWAILKERYMFENELDSLYMYLVGYFHDWVEQIDMTCANSKRLKLDRNAFFINFNYTITLEKNKGLYQIPADHICYIHGDTGKNPFLKPIVGHGNNEYATLINEEDIRNKIESLHQWHNWAKTLDEFEKDLVDEILDLLARLKKEPAKHIEEHNSFFCKCTHSDEIYVLGHSLADVDLPYFEKIVRESPNAKWYVCVVDDKEKKAKFDAISKIVESNKVEFITYDELTMNNDIA